MNKSKNNHNKKTKWIVWAVIIFIIGLLYYAFTGFGSVALAYTWHSETMSFSVRGGLGGVVPEILHLPKPTSVRIPSTHLFFPVTTVEDHGFGYFYKNVEKISLSNNITTIERGAFRDCEKLETVTLPKNLKNLEELAFAECDSLKTIEISDKNNNFTSIDGVLYTKDGKTLQKYPNAKEDKEYTVIDGTEKIADYAMYGATQLEELTLCDTIKEIGDGAFDNQSLKEIDLGNGVEKLGGNIISSPLVKEINIPASIKEISKYAFIYSNGLKEIKVSNENNYFSSNDGNLYDKEQKKLLQYAVDKQGEQFICPDSVQYITEASFCSAKNLKEVKFGSNLKEIGALAFLGSSALEKVELPSALNKIGESAFKDCTLLNCVILHGNNNWQLEKVPFGAEAEGTVVLSYSNIENSVSLANYLVNDYPNYIWQKQES